MRIFADTRRRYRLARYLAAYERHLRALHTETIPEQRADHLDLMASNAELCALATALTDERSGHWFRVADLCRAVAVTERGYVLADPCGYTSYLNQCDFAWASLAGTDDDRARRATYLHALYESISPAMPSGAALVLDDIAASEVAVAVLVGQLEREAGVAL